ncbi:MAG: metallophosphoesterase, partial [Candidatus Accumulibacter sp.]|nr:metallophosphoesterase [Accumulibacter sp.]
MRFIHTADWQIGKPFAGIENDDKRGLVRAERVEAIRRIGELARERRAEAVLVAGDLFDSPRADKATVSALCSAVGSMRLPVFAIPGNHDHGGAGSVWEQAFFLRERESLAPNLHILLKPEAVATEGGA